MPTCTKASTESGAIQMPDKFSRRTFVAGAGATLASATFPPFSAAEPAATSLGEWIDAEQGLPAYRYEGPLRFPNRFEATPIFGLDGRRIPDDPVFLLGNYRLTLFTHASGLVQILSGERAWARMNDGGGHWSGANAASCTIDGTPHELIGLDAAAAEQAHKTFGVGFASFSYRLGDELQVHRSLHVKPSTQPGEGTSAYVVRVRIHNTSARPVTIDYKETVRAKYRPLHWGEPQPGAPQYRPSAPEQLGALSLGVRFNLETREPLTFAPASYTNQFDQAPPALFVHSGSSGAAKPYAFTPSADAPSIGVQYEGSLPAQQGIEFSFVVGYTRDLAAASIDKLVNALSSQDAASADDASLFATAWRKRVPRFEREQDLGLRREMQWNVAVLEAMATWREFYDETIVPQGCMYDYVWGLLASSRDIAQQALPLCHTNPALARSTLRYLLKRTTTDGEVKLMEQSDGYTPSSPMQTSDQQLYLFLLLSEYLRVTGDLAFLKEQLAFYPPGLTTPDTVLAHVRQAFLFLRDRVSVGGHGLVRLWNSDWNDLFYQWPTKESYNVTFETAESCMNTAMAIVILGTLQPLIRRAGDPSAIVLADAMTTLRTRLLEAWNRDLGDRAFPRRAWTDATTSLGEDNMWLEPQGFALLIPEMSTEQKRRLLAQLDRRLLDPEKMGARQIEKPIARPGTPPGSRENGGFWYALHGPLVLGVATFDPALARQLLRRMTFHRFAEQFPTYWTGMWSASDSLDSSLLPTEGLSVNIPFCAHAHAWPLYCYLRLREPTTL